ncbi:hypothetical protein ACFLYS_00165 [Chloroflexota bacterium]
MQNLEFSAPYNDDPETLEELFKLNKLNKNKIREIYLSGPQKYFGSHRITPEMDINGLIKIVARIHEEGIRANVVLNSTCEGIEWYSKEVVNSIMEYLRQMHEEHGLEAVTIANPLYIKEARRRFPDMEICASVLGNVDCVQRAVLYNKLGANVITTDNNINRDLKLLKQIKEATGAELRLMLNEGCIYKCPLRRFHSNATSHLSKEIEKKGVDISFGDFYGFCDQVIREDPSQILKSGWIRPEDTRKYSEITSFFKIVGRGDLKSKVVRATKAYLEESWHGDLLDILFTSLGSFTLTHGIYLDNESLGKYKFFEKITACDKNCPQCDYCEELAKKIISVGVFTPEKAADMDDRLALAKAEKKQAKPLLNKEIC